MASVKVAAVATTPDEVSSPADTRRRLARRLLPLQVAVGLSSMVTSRPGERQPEIAPSCVVHDVLIRGYRGLLNRSRRVEHDYLP